MTTNDVAVHAQASTALTIADDQTAFSQQQVAVLRHMGVDGAADGDLAVFFHVAKRTGLDPFARQIHMIGRNSKNPRTDQWETKYTIQTGIDGFRLIGRRAADARRVTISISAPEWAHEDGSWRPVWSPKWGHPLGARVTIRRGGEPFVAVALFDEYKQTKRGGDLTSMWAQRPAGQIAKCAEALAWRMAFPQDLAGVYTDDEMQQADPTEPTPTPEVNPRSGVSRLRTAVPQQDKPEPEAAAPTEEIHDAEVVDEPPADAEPITTGQTRRMFALFRELGIDDEDRQRAGMSRALGREVESRKAVTKAEAAFIIDSLEARKAQQVAAPVPADDVDWPRVAEPGSAA